MYESTWQASEIRVQQLVEINACNEWGTCKAVCVCVCVCLWGVWITEEALAGITSTPSL